MESTTGVVFTCGAERNDKITVADAVLGKKVINVSGSHNDLFVLCDESTSNSVENITFSKIGAVGSECSTKYSQKFISICGGKSQYLGLTQPNGKGSGQVYSWGSGAAYGEMGLGALSSSRNPILVSTSYSVAGISSGDNHSAVVDDNGNIFIWGQNFSKQLGLYCKPARLPPSAMTESVIMTPRIVPFSLKNSIRQVACGSTFTVAVSKDGDIWSWGSGECGQLGNGRCTSSEVPKVTVPRISDKEVFVNVACGFAHTIALTSAGAVHACGLNHHGQLGLGDKKSRHAMGRNESLSSVTKVYANGNSSACIDSTGGLFSWGSGASYRLMHGSGTLVPI